MVHFALVELCRSRPYAPPGRLEDADGNAEMPDERHDVWRDRALSQDGCPALPNFAPEEGRLAARFQVGRQPLFVNPSAEADLEPLIPDSAKTVYRTLPVA